MNTDEIKDNLRNFYNLEAEHRNSGETQQWKKEQRERFMTRISAENKKTLLELGAGAGRDSLFFMERGLNVTSVDLSPEMVRICRAKGIEAFEMDFCNISALNKKYDCIWAMNSLLHVPRHDFPMVMKEIDSVLNDSGLFYMGMYGGEDGEKHFQNELIEVPRYFASYSEKALLEILSDIFYVLDFEQMNVGRNMDFQAAVLKKK